MKRKLAIIASVFMLASYLTQDVMGQWVHMSLPEGNIRCLGAFGTYLFAGPYGFFRTSDFGLTWVASDFVFSSTSITSVINNGPNLFATTYGKGVFLSTDSGASWKAMNIGLLDLRVNHIAINGTTLFVDTYPYGIFRSTDNAATWVGLDTNSKTSLINIFSDATNEGILFVGDYARGIYRTIDNGTTWIFAGGDMPVTPKIQTLAFKGSDLFCGTDGYGIFRSTNSGVNWTAVNTGITNKHISSLAMSGTSIFAGSSVGGTGGGVFLSTNDGTTWQQVNDGLMDTDVQALTIAGNYLFAGTYREGIWRRPLSELGMNAVKESSQPDLYLFISPNPTTGIISIRNASENVLHVTVSNLLGETLIDIPHPNTSDFTLDLSNLPPGTYFAKFLCDGSVITRKIVKE